MARAALDYGFKTLGWRLIVAMTKPDNLASQGKDGNYTAQPRLPVGRRILWRRPLTADANDFLYQWESSGDYDAVPRLGRIQAALLAINAADDERNPPETGLMENALRQVKGGRTPRTR